MTNLAGGYLFLLRKLRDYYGIRSRRQRTRARRGAQHVRRRDARVAARQRAGERLVAGVCIKIVGVDVIRERGEGRVERLPCRQKVLLRSQVVVERLSAAVFWSAVISDTRVCQSVLLTMPVRFTDGDVVDVVDEVVDIFYALLRTSPCKFRAAYIEIALSSRLFFQFKAPPPSKGGGKHRFPRLLAFYQGEDLCGIWLACESIATPAWVAIWYFVKDDMDVA